MEYILLLTACINPDGMPFTCLADVGVRKKQYIEALNFYLKNTTRKIVFVENSGTDISSSFKDFQHIQKYYHGEEDRNPTMKRERVWRGAYIGICNGQI